MNDTSKIPPVDKDADALRELARREDEEGVVDQQTARAAADAKKAKDGGAS